MHTRAWGRWPLALLLGCFGCDSGGNAPESAPLDVPAGTYMTDADLAAVCEGKPGPEGVASYAKKAGAASPMLVFLRAGKDPFTAKVTTTFGPWRPTSAKDTQLVACVTRTSEKKVRECKFDKEKPAKLVDQFDASYELVVREASTGKEVSKSKFDAKSSETCPTVFFFKTDREQDYAAFEPGLLGMMGSLQPADAPKPELRTDDLMAACEGKPVLGATPYTKKAGSVSPVVVYRREGAEPWVEGTYSGQTFKDHDWWSADAKKYQLVVCMTTKRGAKTKDCEFDGGSKVELVDASYTISIVEAATGKKLDDKTFDAKSSATCPFIWNFREGQENVFVADPGPAAASWLKSFAAP